MAGLRRPRSRRAYLWLLPLCAAMLGTLDCCKRVRQLQFAVVTPRAAEQERGVAQPVSLIGEVRISGEADARSVGAQMLEEARLALDADGWQHELKSSKQNVREKPNISMLDDFLVESTELAGPYGRFGLRLFRGRCTVPFPAKPLYDFLVTPEGYIAIDPLSSPEDYDNAVEKFSWPDRPGAKLQIEFFEMKFPRILGFGLRDREGLVLNVHDPVEMAFLSKTVLHSSLPGGSRYQDSQPVDRGRRKRCRRAATSSSIQVLPLNKTHSILRNLLFWDFCGGLPPKVSNAMMAASFERKFQRIVAKAREVGLS